KLRGHRAQLDRRRQLGADIGVEGGGRLTLERLEDRAALIVGERLEGVGNGDERVVGRVLGGKFRRHHIGRRRVGNRQGAVHQYRVRRRGGARRMRARLFLAHLAGWRLLGLLLLRLLLRLGRWRLRLSGGKAGAGGKCQRERAGAQESILHANLLLVRSARALSGPPPCASSPAAGPQTSPPEPIFGFVPRARLNRSFPRKRESRAACWGSGSPLSRGRTDVVCRANR